MSNGLIDIEELVYARREAYLTAVENKMENDNVVGYFGFKIPEAVFYAFDLVPIPFEGVDSYIFEFGHEKGLCDVINSTKTYLTTEKCPIIFSCKFFVLMDFCKKMQEEMESITERKLIIFQDEEKLIQEIKEVENKAFDEDKYKMALERLEYINSVLEKIDKDKNINTEEAFLIRYYTKYMKLDERYEYFKRLESNYTFTEEMSVEIKRIYALCPRGGYKGIIKNIKDNGLYRIYFDIKDADYSYENCPINHKKKIKYEV